MRSSRVVFILILGASIGMPVSVAVSEDCRKAAFDLAWAAKVRAMQVWNKDPKHRSYVDKYKLKTADHSKATAALKARMLKAFDIACGVGLKEQPVDGLFSPGLDLERLQQIPETAVGFDDVELAPSTLVAQLEPLPDASYDLPEKQYASDAFSASPGYGGFGSYGFPGVPVGGVPGSPIAPTPEPASFALVLAGLVGLWRIGGRNVSN